MKGVSTGWGAASVLEKKILCICLKMGLCWVSGARADTAPASSTNSSYGEIIADKKAGS